MKIFQNVLAVTGMIAVPAAAFLIRMWQGDTRNENEVLISQWVRAIVTKYLGGQNKEMEQ